MLEEEFERTRRMSSARHRPARTARANPVLARSIRLRNPYVDPMSLIQVELLRRKRAASRAQTWNTLWARPSTASPPACTTRARKTEDNVGTASTRSHAETIVRDPSCPSWLMPFLKIVNPSPFL